VARTLCWFWCFRYAVGRRIHETDLALWQWRLLWLSLDSEPSDETFLAGLREQQITWWSRLAGIYDLKLAQDAIHALEGEEVQPKPALQRLHDVTTKWLLQFAGIGQLAGDLALRLSVAERLESLDAVREPAILSFANTILSPAAASLLKDLREHIDLLLTACKFRHVRSPEIVSWSEGLKRLDAMVRMLEEERSSADGFHAILWFVDRADRLSEPSAANLFVWLRHSCDAVGRDTRLFHILCEHLTSAKVKTLFESSTLPRGLQLRLGIVHHAFKGHLGQQILIQSLGSLKLQRQLGGPLSLVARRDAEVGSSHAMQELLETVGALQDIETRCLKEDSPMWGDLWSCRMERGGLRKLTGAVLLRMQQDNGAVTDWLQPAVADFRSAIEAARHCELAEQPKLILRAALEGILTARAIADDDAIEEFERSVEPLRKIPELQIEIQRLEAAGRNDPLVIAQEEGLRDALDPNDEESIQRFTDDIMRATGYPEDRRANVADDIRKIAKTEKAKREFCRYLEPLQNLAHTSSPATVYSRPTKYVCSCTLLGYETRIETEDIDTVFAAMQRTYCDECDKRNPGGDTDT
jgi:hypothetical protein